MQSAVKGGDPLTQETTVSLIDLIKESQRLAKEYEAFQNKIQKTVAGKPSLELGTMEIYFMPNGSIKRRSDARNFPIDTNVLFNNISELNKFIEWLRKLQIL